MMNPIRCEVVDTAPDIDAESSWCDIVTLRIWLELIPFDTHTPVGVGNRTSTVLLERIGALLQPGDHST